MNKWWDGYDHEDVVVLDDFDPKHAEFLSYYLKNLGRPLFIQCRGKRRMMRIRPKTIIVTSQYSLDACFPEKETLAAISRRFRVHQIAPFDDTPSGPSLYRQYSDYLENEKKKILINKPKP